MIPSHPTVPIIIVVIVILISRYVRRIVIDFRADGTR